MNENDSSLRANLRANLEQAADAFAICQLAFSAAYARWQRKYPEEERDWKANMGTVNAVVLAAQPGWLAEVEGQNRLIRQAEQTLKAAALAFHAGKETL